MLNENTHKKLTDRVLELTDYVSNNEDYLICNEEALEIYEGNLMSKVLDIMQQSLSPQYYSKVKHRVIPINFLQKIIDKLAKVYITKPVRSNDNKKFIEFYEKTLDLNSMMNIADEYSHLFKGYALEPYINHRGKPQVRIIPFDEFLVKGDDLTDKLRMTVFIKLMGSREKTIVDDRTLKEKVIYVDWYIAYTDDEIMAFDKQGTIIKEVTAPTGHKNPLGRIPFVYGNRSRQRLLPQQDTDIIQMTKVLPVILSDLAGAIMFQCFTIMYGIDVNAADFTMSPNAFWDIKSDNKTEQKAEIGTIKPEVDSNKVLEYFRMVFSAWLESKSIKVGATGKLDGEDAPSGISKLIDEMDTFEVRKRSIEFFQKEERDLWDLLAIMNNHWQKSGELAKEYMFGVVDIDVVNKTLAVDFEPPRPAENRDSVVDTQIKELGSGLTTQERAIAKINPELSEVQVKELLRAINSGTEEIRTDDNKGNEDGTKEDEIKEDKDGNKGNV